MKRKSPYKIIRALTFVFAFGILSLSASSTAFTQKEIDPACVELCRQQLFECIAATGSEHKCGHVYRTCLAHNCRGKR